MTGQLTYTKTIFEGDNGQVKKSPHHFPSGTTNRDMLKKLDEIKGLFKPI